jgi:D-threonine aldolase
MAELASRHGVALRPHAKAHKSVAIAKIQIDAGATGICCQKLSEAYPFAAAGIEDIFISNEFVGADKVSMAIDLAKRVKLSVCVDHIDQVVALGRAAKDAGVSITVLIEVEVGQGRCGVSRADEVFVLLDEIARHTSLNFGGIQAYHGGIQHRAGWQERREAAQISAQKAASYVQQLDNRGVQCTVITGSGTGTAEFDAASGVFTEIQPGSYVFMDAHYSANVWRKEFHPKNSLFIASTVMSTAKPGRIICDAGLKSVAVDSGLPIKSARHRDESMNYIAANDEHGIIEIQKSETEDLLGKKIYLIPGHCDPTVNLYDQYVVFKNDRVEALWDIEARGLSR